MIRAALVAVVGDGSDRDEVSLGGLLYHSEK
jgi:hypothetical protein